MAVRVFSVSAFVLVTVLVILVGSWLTPATAQDQTTDRLTVLETQIADQGTEVAGIRRRVQRLERAVLTPQAEDETEPTPQAEAEAEAPAAVTAGGDLGTRGNPIPIGTAADVGDGWTITVLESNPNAADAILAANQFNDPPAEGQQFFMVTIRATYNGSEESTSFLFDVTIQGVGQSGVSYSPFDSGCGVLPMDLPVLNDVFQGGTIEGNTCWSIDAADADSLLMYTETDFGETRVFFDV